MISKGNALLVFFVLVPVALVTVLRTLPPAPLPANAPEAEFSAERAMRHIESIATQPRFTGTPEYDTARNYILAELDELGLETETQTTGNIRNTLAWIEGTIPLSGIVLLTAHLDSVAENPGASDDGSGVAVLLETARALTYAAPLRNTVVFLFTDFEEGGFFGAKAFISQHPWANEVKVVIGLDAGGPSGPGVLSATSRDNGWLIRQLVQADAQLVGSSAINALASSSTDFGRAFKSAGFSGYAFDLYWDRFDLYWISPIYRTLEDTLENVSLPSIQHQGHHALSLVRHFGYLESLSDPREPDAIYFSVLRLFTIAYSSTWAVPLAIAVTGLFFSVLVLGLMRRMLTRDGLVFGSFVMLTGVILAPLPNLALEKWMPGMIPGLASRSVDQQVVIATVVLSALALIALWYSLSQRIRSTSIPDLTFGALVPILFGMILTSIFVPALSFIFIWPLSLSMLSCAHWFYLGTRLETSKPAIAGLLLCGAANIVIIGPTILLGLFDQMPLTLFLLGGLCGFLAPLFHLALGNRTAIPEQMLIGT